MTRKNLRLICILGLACVVTVVSLTLLQFNHDRNIKKLKYGERSFRLKSLEPIMKVSNDDIYSSMLRGEIDENDSFHQQQQQLEYKHQQQVLETQQVSETQQQVSETQQKVLETQQQVSETQQQVSETQQQVSETQQQVSETQQQVSETQQQNVHGTSSNTSPSLHQIHLNMATQKTEKLQEKKQVSTKRKLAALHKKTIRRKGKSRRKISKKKSYGPVPYVPKYPIDRKGYWYKEEPLVETSDRVPRKLSPSETRGEDILFTIKTTQIYHKERVQLLLDTWLSAVNASNVYLVTDQHDPEYMMKADKIGMHYRIADCKIGHERSSLCCKTGTELELMFKPENKHYNWLCHMDDDIYIHLNNTVKLFSLFDPQKEAIYLGQPRTEWFVGRLLAVNQTMIKDITRQYQYAFGGFYCFSRPMLEKTQQWLGTPDRMVKTCEGFKEVEDASVGATVELLAGERLTRTNLYQSHGNILADLDPNKLKDQIAINYGCGFGCGKRVSKANAVVVPNARFTSGQDPTRFYSVHCYFYPQAPLCSQHLPDLTANSTEIQTH